MNRTSSINAGGVVLALLASVLMAARPTTSVGGRETETGGSADGGAARIVSASTVADRLLADLCPPDRIVAVTTQSLDGPDAHRHRGRATITSLEDIEEIVSLRPDLVLTHNVADARRVERLREAGLRVTDLGTPTGISALRDDVATVAEACGVPDVGRRYVEAFERRMRAVAADIPEAERRQGIYVGLYGDRLFGGTRGTSYHDVLTAAGLRDVAAERYTGWPQYSIEQLLELDPEVIVTRAGMERPLCEHPSLRQLRACDGAVIGVEGHHLDDPGPGMLDAAEAVRTAVYP